MSVSENAIYINGEKDVLITKKQKDSTVDLFNTHYES